MTSPLTKKQWEASVAEMWSASVKATCQDLIDEAVKAEREACAKMCETLGVHPALNVWGGGPDWYKHGKDCAAAIRARGQA
jgi:hypothetical protein